MDDGCMNWCLLFRVNLTWIQSGWVSAGVGWNGYWVIAWHCVAWDMNDTTVGTD